MSKGIIPAETSNVKSATDGYFFGKRPEKQTEPQAADFLSIRQFARLVGIRHETIRKHVVAGKIPAYRCGKFWRIPKSVLSKFTNSTGTA